MATQVVSWIIATQAQLGFLEQAHVGLAMPTDQHRARGELCSVLAVFRLAEHDPVAAWAALEPVLERAAPVTRTSPSRRSPSP
ncbi:hypothetical protein [Streptomyces sp. NPDC089799]|uniref:hypothetical protein n=1 Tax=Streptomyces sp. NPDC089799 TaxID=3155066 RepID=UPI0034166079